MLIKQTATETLENIKNSLQHGGGALQLVYISVFLQRSHAFERTVGYYLPMMGGSTVAYG
jgi:hypothetical protein